MLSLSNQKVQTFYDILPPTADITAYPYVYVGLKNLLHVDLNILLLLLLMKHWEWLWGGGRGGDATWSDLNCLCGYRLAAV